MRNLLIWFLTIFCANVASGQEKLYVSTQTGEMTRIEGSGGPIVTDDNETLTCNCSSDGPIKYEIQPLSIGINSNVTVQGYAMPDLDAAPEAGTSEWANIGCDCTWSWKTWDEVANAKNVSMSKDKSSERLFEVISILITNDTQESMCNCGIWKLTSNSYPDSDDNVTWYVGDIVVGSGKNLDLPYNKDYVGQSAFAKLDFGGVTWTSESTTLQKWGSETVNYTAAIFQSPVTLTLEPDPSDLNIECDITWTGPGTENCSGLNCSVTKNEGVSEWDDEVVVSYDNHCGVKGSYRTRDVHLAHVIDVTGPEEIHVANMEYINWRNLFNIVWSDGRKPSPLPNPSFSDNLLHNPLGAGHDGWVCRIGITVTITVGTSSFQRYVLIINTDQNCQ